MRETQFQCTACKKPIEVGLINAHLMEEESIYNDNFTFLCPFCSNAQFKAFQQVEFINWLEERNMEDKKHVQLPVPTISYIFEK